MARIFISPSKYIQGPGELAKLGEYTQAYGKSALVIITAGGLKRSGDVISKSFEDAKVELHYDNFNGECSQAEIDRLVQVLDACGAEVVVGVGGGKIFDTAKAVAATKDLPVIIVPTIAATDAPCSALSVIYTDEGQFKEYQFFKQNPNLVLMDTEVIAKSPVRLTVSGMGDALATFLKLAHAGAPMQVHALAAKLPMPQWLWQHFVMRLLWTKALRLNSHLKQALVRKLSRRSSRQIRCFPALALSQQVSQVPTPFTTA